MSNFQITLIGIFITAAVLSVLVFAGIIKIGSNNQVSNLTGEVVVWGTTDSATMANLLENFNQNTKTYTIRYFQKDKNNYSNDLTEAFAAGLAPDIFMLPNDLILRHKNKILEIPYASYPERNFKDNFISGSEIYLTKTGVLALPFTVDPLVMYYNRAIFEKAGIVKAPVYWDEFPNLVSKITEKESSLNIKKSAVALGSYDNLNYAKDILATIMIQSGNPIVGMDGENLTSFLDQNFNLPIKPAESALRFFNSFSSPTNPVYTWNKTLPNSQKSFTSEVLAIYFGLSSELFSLRNQNPNLDYDVAMMPQVENSKIKATFGHMAALAISKTSKNALASFDAVGVLTSSDFLQKLSLATNTPPIRRDLLSVRPSIPYYAPIFYDSALVSKAWLDPEPNTSDQIFRNLISDTTSGRLLISEAIDRAHGELGQSLK